MYNNNINIGGNMAYKHGQSNTRLYHIWQNMKKRCYDSTNKDYARYGQRGIKICKRWLNDFSSFYEWSYKHGYNDTLTIDRVDINKSYTPNNCRWVTPQEQAYNRCTNRNIVYNNENKPIAYWAKQFNISEVVIAYRLGRGWSVEQTLETPVGKTEKLYTYNGETHNIIE